jgi:hypothetical protein
MRTILATSLLLCAGLAFGGSGTYEIQTYITTHSSTSTLEQTSTIYNVNGYIDSILIDCPTASTVTGTVSVVAVRPFSTLADFTLATKTDATADLTVRPRFDGTSTDGSALTSDPPDRYLAVNEALKFAVTNCNATSVVWRCLIRVETK